MRLLLIKSLNISVYGEPASNKIFQTTPICMAMPIPTPTTTATLTKATSTSGVGTDSATLSKVVWGRIATTGELIKNQHRNLPAGN